MHCDVWFCLLTIDPYIVWTARLSFCLKFSGFLQIFVVLTVVTVLNCFPSRDLSLLHSHFCFSLGHGCPLLEDRISWFYKLWTLVEPNTRGK